MDESVRDASSVSGDSFYKLVIVVILAVLVLVIVFAYAKIVQ